MFRRIGRVGERRFGCEVLVDEDGSVKLIPDGTSSIVLSPDEFRELVDIVQIELSNRERE